MLTKKEIARRYYLKHGEKIKAKSKKWRKDNPEKMKERNKIYYEENRGKEKIRARRWQRLNPEKAKELSRQWKRSNREYLIKYRAEHRELRRQWDNNRRRTDLRCNLNHKMSAAVRTSLKSGKNGRHWEDLVGYTSKVLMQHLKGTIPKGYTWEDFLSGKLHLDHNIPMSAFNFSKPEHIDFKRCWALTNLQLLPAKENLTKNAKLSEPFQPSLKV